MARPANLRHDGGVTPQTVDANTPIGGTAISEWLRLVDNAVDARTTHEVRNLLTGLVSIRDEALHGGWTERLRGKDNACEAHLRMILRGLPRRRLFFCEVTKTLVPGLAICGG